MGEQLSVPRSITHASQLSVTYVRALNHTVATNEQFGELLREGNSGVCTPPVPHNAV